VGGKFIEKMKHREYAVRLVSDFDQGAGNARIDLLHLESLPLVKKVAKSDQPFAVNFTSRRFPAGVHDQHAFDTFCSLINDWIVDSIMLVKTLRFPFRRTPGSSESSFQ